MTEGSRVRFHGTFLRLSLFLSLLWLWNVEVREESLSSFRMDRGFDRGKQRRERTNLLVAALRA